LERSFGKAKQIFIEILASTVILITSKPLAECLQKEIPGMVIFTLTKASYVESILKTTAGGK
jgi:hypothetical protein